MQSTRRPIDISYWTSMETIERGLTGKGHQQIELERSRAEKENEERTMQSAAKLQELRDRILSNQLYARQRQLEPLNPEPKDEHSKLLIEIDSKEDTDSSDELKTDPRENATKHHQPKNRFEAATDFNDSFSFLADSSLHTWYQDSLKYKKIEDTAAVFRAILNSNGRENIPVGDFEVHFMSYLHDSRITGGRIEVRLTRQETCSTIHISPDLEELKTALREDIKNAFESESVNPHPAIVQLYNDFFQSLRESLN